MYFWTYRLRKTWLDKCLKSLVSEDFSASNMVNGAKHCSKLNETIFTGLISACADSSDCKGLSEWYAKS